jgi:predicted metal-binding membrane protein
MHGGRQLESLLKRDRAVVFAGLAGVTALAWGYLVVTAGGMTGMGDAIMAAAPKPWTATEFTLTLAMWPVMMVAMMLPGAAPMILLYALVARKQGERGASVAPAGVFAAGYLAVWSAFSLAATGLQWGLEQAALLSPMMAGAGPLLGGALLAAAGIYQFTPLKGACLAHCRSPFFMLANGWRPGAAGALRMGFRHGAFCVGCCWVLMALLFVGGVMNLLWVAAIAGFVLIEKLAPFGVATGRLAGALLILAGAAVAFAG